MAATFDSITPADSSTDVAPNSSVVVEMSDPAPADLDETLMEITVNGVSCTTANGGLEYWSEQDVSGGVMVADKADLVFRTLHDWFKVSGETVTVTVDYNSSTLSTTTFTAAETDTGRHWTSRGDAVYRVIPPLNPVRTEMTAHYVVAEPRMGTMDAHYTVGRWVREILTGGVVVGEPSRHVVTGGVVVEGTLRKIVTGGVVVQNYTWHVVTGGVVVGEKDRHVVTGGVVVGVPSRSVVTGGVVVYAVIDDTVVEIDAAHATTRTFLESLGITYG